MPVHNSDIAAVFDEMADLLEIRGDNPFRIRAYRNASRIIGDSGRELRDLVAANEDLTAIAGIGADLSKKIIEIVNTGKSEALDTLRKEFPDGITELLRIPGLGPKRVKVLWKDLGIESMAKLEQAAKNGKIRGIAEFGEKIEQNILHSIQAKQVEGKRFLRAAIAPSAEALRSFVEAMPGAKQVTLCGSYRRGRETVGDLDILAVANDATGIMDRFVKYDEVTKVLAKGDTKSSVILRSGIQADLRVVPAESFGAALQYFTGSQGHNVATRAIAQKLGLKLNEYGLTKGDEVVAGKTEKDIYKALGLDLIPPELREGRGEIEAATAGKIPKLIELGDLKGDLHNHSTWSDGANTIEEMAAAAKARGFEYLAITDHSKRLTVANGLDEKRLLKQIDEIDELSAELKGIALLKGIEVDILDDGALDLSDDVLKRLDVVVGSVHSRFNLSHEKQTERVLRAMDNPYFTILGHPTGRLLLERPAFEVDVPKIIAHASKRGCFLELNANPHRLDLHDVHCKMAREAGVLISIDCDAHSTKDFENQIHGIVQARRGWLEKGDVLNTRSLAQLRSLLKKSRG